MPGDYLALGYLFWNFVRVHQCGASYKLYIINVECQKKKGGGGLMTGNEPAILATVVNADPGPRVFIEGRQDWTS